MAKMTHEQLLIFIISKLEEIIEKSKCKSGYKGPYFALSEIRSLAKKAIEELRE
jgi:hypothetical protein